MISGISGMHWYGIRQAGYGGYSAMTKGGMSRVDAAADAAPAAKRQSTQSTAGSIGMRAMWARGTEPAAEDAETGRVESLFRKGVDPVEYAVRMRIQYLDPSSERLEEGRPVPSEAGERVSGSVNARAVGQEEKCQTCEKRKYQDGSDDMGVSFQTPTRVAPEAAASAVRGHEQEHVVREQAKAEREGRRVVSQDVILHTDICPECGRVYISGGTTRTVTAADSSQSGTGGEKAEAPERRPFLAVA